MTSMRRLSLMMAVLASLAFCCQGTSASGSIVGTVVDQTGAVIAGASVDLRNEATGLVRNGTTDASGEYTFVLLQPGTYDVVVRLQGFQEGIYKGIKLDVDEVTRANLTLQIAPA